MKQEGHVLLDEILDGDQAEQVEVFRFEEIDFTHEARARQLRRGRVVARVIRGNREVLQESDGFIQVARDKLIEDRKRGEIILFGAVQKDAVGNRL